MRMPAPSRSPFPQRRRPTIGVSAMASPPWRLLRIAPLRRRRFLGPPVVNPQRGSKAHRAGRLGASRRCAQALRLAAPPKKPPDDLDDNERYEPAEQHVREI